MGNLRFPSRLKPIVSKGYSQTRGSNIYRNEVQGGLPRQGRDTYFEAVPISVTLVVSSLGRQAFLSFLNNIHGGADSFIMPHDTGYGVQDHQVMITSTIGDSTDDGINWIITFTATAERTAIQEDNCLTQNLPDLFGCYGESIHGFLNAYGVSQTTFPRIWSSEGPAGYPPINMQQLTLDGRIAYSGPSVTYLSSVGTIASSGVNEWPLQFVGGVAVGRVAPENQSANIALQSSLMTNAAWVKANTTVTLQSSGEISPGKTFKATPSTANATHQVSQTVNGTFVAGDKYTFSYVVKNSGYNFARLRAADEVGIAGDLVVNLSTGAITVPIAGSVSTNIGNGFFSIAKTITIKSGGATSLNISSWVYDNSSNATFAGDGTSGIIISAMQIEKSDFTTSPIFTSASSVSRPAASASVFMNGATSINITYSDASVVNVVAVSDYAQIPQANSAWGSKFITRIDFNV